MSLLLALPGNPYSRLLLDQYKPCCCTQTLLLAFLLVQIYQRRIIHIGFEKAVGETVGKMGN